MGRTDSLEKTLMLGKIENRRRGREDEVVGWHHQLDGDAFKQVLGVDDGQRDLVCCSPWGRNKLAVTEQLSWTKSMQSTFSLKYWLWRFYSGLRSGSPETGKDLGASDWLTDCFQVRKCGREWENKTRKRV